MPGLPASVIRILRPIRGLVLSLAVLAGCTPVPGPSGSSPPAGEMTAQEAAAAVAADRAARNFIDVVGRVAPAAELACRERTRGRRCDYLILIDARPGVPSNAFQTVDPRGRPVIVFTLPLIAEARNQDELAFILGHEAAHHIAGHLELTEANARLGAQVLGSLAAANGYDQTVVDSAAALGAELGMRRFSKEYELQADALGAVIARAAGYDPVVGAAFFARIPDPGDEFLGTHPPNAARQEVILRADGRS